MKVERRAQIADLINQQRTITNTELMERFGISIETVRRDLDYLEKQGVLRKVYGGAVVNVSLNTEAEYASRSKTNLPQKNAIAREAAALICPGDAVYLGVGTTIQAMVPFLKNVGGFTVFTNALRTAVELSEIPDCTVEGYDFSWLRSRNDYCLAARQLSNCLGDHSPLGAPVLCIRKQGQTLAAVEVSGRKVLQARGFDNAALEDFPELFQALGKWMERFHLMWDEEEDGVVIDPIGQKLPF